MEMESLPDSQLNVEQTKKKYYILDGASRHKQQQIVKRIEVLFNMLVANIYSSPWICTMENILNSHGFTYISLQQCKQPDTWVDYILK